MIDQRKRRLAGWLLGLGLLALVIGFAVYQNNQQEADSTNDFNNFVAGAVGKKSEHVDTDMTVPLVLWIGGGASVLSAVILFAGARDETPE